MKIAIIGIKPIMAVMCAISVEGLQRHEQGSKKKKNVNTMLPTVDWLPRGLCLGSGVESTFTGVVWRKRSLLCTESCPNKLFPVCRYKAVPILFENAHGCYVRDRGSGTAGTPGRCFPQCNLIFELNETHQAKL